MKQIEYLMKAGKDMVKGRTSERNICLMIEQATTKEITTDYPGFPICVNGKFYLPEISDKPKRPKKKR